MYDPTSFPKYGFYSRDYPFRLILIILFSTKNQQGSQKHRFGKIDEGPENIISKKSAKIGKSQRTLKNTKYIHFFQNFKHIKQQQHRINTLEHKYGESTNIYIM